MSLLRSRWRPCLGLPAMSLVVLLGACAWQQPLQPTPSVVAAPQPTVPDGPVAGVRAYEQRQRAAAGAAAREGRWGDAVWAWDIVLALSPQDADAQKGRQTALAQIQSQVAERLPQAKAARARGQVDLASRLYLEVLALAPGQLEAANALRAIERDRARRQAVGSFARAMVPPDAGRSETQGHAAAGRPDLEHASLLAGQGDVDAAIALLLPTPASRPVDAASRKLLAELLLKRADTLAASNPAAAIESVRQSLRWQPGNAPARTRLQQLLADAPAGAKEPAPRRPISKPSSAPSSGR